MIDPDASQTTASLAGDSLAGFSLSGGEPSESMAGASVAGASTAGAKPGVKRQTFGTEELALVLSRYDLGPLDAIQAYPRGSRRAPKLLLRRFETTDSHIDDLDDLESELKATLPDSALDLAAPIETDGEPVDGAETLWLLKRRARSRGGDSRVSFCHAVQRHLAAHRFPIAPLVVNRSGNTITALGSHRYEVFEYIRGNAYDQSLEATGQAGRMLAVFHQLAQHFNYTNAGFTPPTHGYHRADMVARSFNRLPTTVQKIEPNVDRAALGHRNQFLHEAYLTAANTADKAGLDQWPTQVVHADWHPGNTLFAGQKVVAVIDFDAARVQPRSLDVANGALQFSIIGGRNDTQAWPDYIDEGRFKRFIRGYDAVPGAVLSRAELRILPHLMIEALVAESVIPIAASGRFSRTAGSVFLEMIERKVRWLQAHADALFRSVDV